MQGAIAHCQANYSQQLQISVKYPSSVTLRKLLPFLNSRAFVYQAIARFFSNNKYNN
jgi:hypothetical protein